MDSVEQEVSRIVALITSVAPERFTVETDLKSELNVDSLQGLQIIAALEKRFQLTIPDEDLDSYTTIRAIANVVKKQQAN